MILFLAPPFMMCLVLSGIHCYLGLHVLARGVIFIDLSLAQVAAFGATLGLSLGFSPDSSAVYICSLLATFIAALIFSITRVNSDKFSQEAVIGIVYALGSASVVLLANNMSHGSEHIKQLLTGQILWVSWTDVFKTAIIYSLAGSVHYKFRKKLIQASFSKTHPGSQWDLMFYLLFGVIITSSVQVAGVLLVFSFLIVPSLVSAYFFSGIRERAIFGWIFSICLSLTGLILSFIFDLPSGACLVVCLSLCPIILILYSVAVKILPTGR